MARSDRPAEPSSSSPATAPPSFDARLQRIEAIVAELEQKGLDLEPAIERYQEGIELLKQCHLALAQYRQRVEELSADAEQSLKPYLADPDAREPGAGR